MLPTAPLKSNAELYVVTAANTVSCLVCGLAMRHSGGNLARSAHGRKHERRGEAVEVLSGPAWSTFTRYEFRLTASGAQLANARLNL